MHSYFFATCLLAFAAAPSLCLAQSLSDTLAFPEAPNGSSARSHGQNARTLAQITAWQEQALASSRLTGPVAVTEDFDLAVAGAAFTFPGRNLAVEFLQALPPARLEAVYHHAVAPPIATRAEAQSLGHAATAVMETPSLSGLHQAAGVEAARSALLTERNLAPVIEGLRQLALGKGEAAEKAGSLAQAATVAQSAAAFEAAHSLRRSAMAMASPGRAGQFAHAIMSGWREGGSPASFTSTDSDGKELAAVAAVLTEDGEVQPLGELCAALAKSDGPAHPEAYAEVLYWRAIQLMGVNDPAGAEGALTTALELDTSPPLEARLLICTGSTYAHRLDYVRAAAYLLDAADLAQGAPKEAADAEKMLQQFLDSGLLNDTALAAVRAKRPAGSVASTNDKPQTREEK